MTHHIWAVTRGTAETVEVLLAAGADAKAETQDPIFGSDFRCRMSHAPTALDQALCRHDVLEYQLVHPDVDWAPGERENASSTSTMIMRRMVPLLVRAGATISERHAEYSCYLRACLDAGGVRAYERLHRTTLANILKRGDRLPASVIPKIVEFWAHVGWYAIEHDLLRNDGA